MLSKGFKVHGRMDAAEGIPGQEKETGPDPKRGPPATKAAQEPYLILLGSWSWSRFRLPHLCHRRGGGLKAHASSDIQPVPVEQKHALDSRRCLPDMGAGPSMEGATRRGSAR